MSKQASTAVSALRKKHDRRWPSIVTREASADEAGASTKMYFTIGDCSLGAVLVAQSTKGVCAILLGDDPAALVRDLYNRFPGATVMGQEAGCEALLAKVVACLENPRIGLDAPLDVRGTAFQRLVWKTLRQIPPGSTLSYSEVASKIGMAKAVRAVARACGANVLAVAIPCHRVVSSDGSLSGYRWGVQRKRALLKRESRVRLGAARHR